MTDNNNDKKLDYQKLYTLNFSKPEYGAQARELFKFLSLRFRLPSMGQAVLLAVRFVLEDEELVKRFSEYVDKEYMKALKENRQQVDDGGAMAAST